MSMAELIPAHLPDEALVKPASVAGWLGVNVATVRVWARSGRLPAMLLLGPKTHKFRVGELRQALSKLDAKPVTKKRR